MCKFFFMRKNLCAKKFGVVTFLGGKPPKPPNQGGIKGCYSRRSFSVIDIEICKAIP